MSNEGRNEEHNDGYDFDLEHEAMAGEIVEIDGYDGYWRVDCVRIDIEKSVNEQFTDIYYDLYNIHTDQYIVACDEDISLVADASQADDFVANTAPKMRKPIDPGEPKTIYRGNWIADVPENGFMKIDMEAINMAGNNERKLTKREQTNKEVAEKKAARKKKAEEIDNLLDLRNDAQRLFTGDELSDRLFAIDAKLAEASDGE